MIRVWPNPEISLQCREFVRAVDWTITDGQLNIMDVDRPIATFTPGSWTFVELVDRLATDGAA